MAGIELIFFLEENKSLEKKKDKYLKQPLKVKHTEVINK